MASLYGFAYSEDALKYLETKVPAKIRGQIKRRIEALAAKPTPPGSKKLISELMGSMPFTACDKGSIESCIPSAPSSL